MPRLSIYVPDDLWRRATELHREALAGAENGPDGSVASGPSHVLQLALERWLESAEAKPAYARLSPALEATRSKLLATALEKLAHEYQAGYATGLELLDDLPWEAFLELRTRGWNLKSWIAELGRWELPLVNAAAEEEGRVFDWKELWERAASQHFTTPPAEPDGPVAEGVIDALRDVLADATTAATSPASTSGRKGGTR